MGSCNGIVHALDKATGKPRWTYNALQDGGNRAEFHGLPLVAGDLLIFASDDRTPGGRGFVYGFERDSGKVRWKRPVGRGVMTDVVSAGAHACAVTLDDELICLEPSTGRPVWSLASGWANPEGKNVLSTPAADGEQVLFGGHNGVVQALATASGRVLWKRDAGSAVVTPLTVLDGIVYFGTADGRLRGLRAKDGTSPAELDVGGVPFGPPTPAAGLLLLYVYEGTEAGTLKAIDPSLNEVRWSRRPPGGWSASRPYIQRDAVVAGGDRGELAALSQRDGSSLWSETLGGTIRGIGGEGEVLYVGLLKGTVYACRAPEASRTHQP